MPYFEFTLIVKLPPDAPEPEAYIDALFEAGGDDATVGIVKPDQITLEFWRAAGTERGAIESALRDFLDAIAIVRKAAENLDETYQIEVQVEGQRIGEAVVGFKQPLFK